MDYRGFWIKKGEGSTGAPLYRAERTRAADYGRPVTELVCHSDSVGVLRAIDRFIAASEGAAA